MLFFAQKCLITKKTEKTKQKFTWARYAVIKPHGLEKRWRYAVFYVDALGTFFFPVFLISEYASVTINVYLHSVHLGIWNVIAVLHFP